MKVLMRILLTVTLWFPSTVAAEMGQHAVRPWRIPV